VLFELFNCSVNRLHSENHRKKICCNLLIVSVHRLLLVYVLHRRITINGWTYRHGKVTFRWRNLYCVPFRYYLLNCDLSRTYQSRNYRRKLKSILKFYIKVYFLFVSTAVRCFYSNTGSFYIGLLRLSRKKRIIFVDFYKCFKAISSIRFIQMSLLTNST